MVGIELPAAVIPTPATFELVETMADRVRAWSLNTLFLCGSAEGLEPLVVAQSLAGRDTMPALGLCIHGRDKNGFALACDLRTAAALGLRHFFLKEPDYRLGRPVNFESTLTIIESLRAHQGESFCILVENAFLDPSDEKLLLAQLEAGANYVVSRFAAGYLPELAAKHEGVSLSLLPVDSEGDGPPPGRPESIVDLSELAGEVVFERGDRIFL